MTPPVLVTGAAGFIGSHLSAHLLASGRRVVGIDNLNDYYDVRLKQARLELLQRDSAFHFERLDLADNDGVARLFHEHRFDRVFNLAAQAGVRYSLQHPHTYVDTNITGFLNVLEGCRHTGVGHLLYASSSSVYGGNTRMPFTIHDDVDHPLSMYAATKRANELMAHSYAHLFGVPCTGLRFFTVYGPWGRPDMSLFIFTKAILEGRPIDLFNHGRHRRDFTYIDDIVAATAGLIDIVPTRDERWDAQVADPAASSAPFKLYNVGSHRPVELTLIIELLEREIGRKAEINLLPMQPGDVEATYADVAELHEAVGHGPETSIEEGIRRFVAWYREHHGV
jgi:UDP-glucuronate 4-epimerase